MPLSQPLNVAATSPAQDGFLQNRQGVVLELVESRMHCSGYSELRRIACDLHDQVLTLRGRVSSYYLKQLAQSLVFTVDGVRELNNQLEVVPPLRW